MSMLNFHDRSCVMVYIVPEWLFMAGEGGLLMGRDASKNVNFRGGTPGDPGDWRGNSVF